MASSTNHTSEPQHLGTTTADKLFIAFLVLVVAAVTLLGVVNYKEAIKVETSKSNGEAWVAWLTETGTTRFEANTQHPACKGGVKPQPMPKLMPLVRGVLAWPTSWQPPI